MQSTVSSIIPSCLWSWPRPVFISASAWDLYRFTRLPEGIASCHGKNRTDEKGTSPFQALMVSSAACVGTGNIIGISTAICLGGPGAVFWMTVMALIGAASSFVECTLAQIYKRKNSDGTSYGGPAYYIEDALHNKTLATAFVVFLLLTYSFGFNLVCSYNVQSTSLSTVSMISVTPAIIGPSLPSCVGPVSWGVPNESKKRPVSLCLHGCGLCHCNGHRPCHESWHDPLCHFHDPRRRIQFQGYP